MALAAGTRLGPYEIVAPLGAGGMGEVYRARDLKLGRDVAIKVLLPTVADDPERLARFGREAQLLASLNHPHIAQIYGLEEADGVRALVMELVEGHTLADRIAQGAIPFAEALSVSKQIAEALEAAHEQGIIHRDLKPANIKLRPDGTVKVLDFGLAKALNPSAGSAANAVADSPTLTSPAMTRLGMILGTAGYMSPEQARGLPLDRRTDIWAFGCVLYEMLTARQPFPGDTVSDTVAGILSRDPDWATLPEATSAAIRRLLRRCLEKDRRRRLADAADARLEIDDALALSAVDAVASPASPSRRLAPVAIAGTLVGGALIGALLVWAVMRPGPEPSVQPSRFVLVPPPAQALVVSGAVRDIVLSGDGTQLIYTGGQGQLMVRPLDQLDARPLAGVANARAPFLSPDGRWIGFFTGTSGELKKVAIAGGTPVTLCRIVGSPRGASWGPDDTIVFATNEPTTGLFRVRASGGKPDVLTTPDSGKGMEEDHLAPSLLPDGRAVLFTSAGVSSNAANAEVAVLDLATGQRKILIRGGSQPEYVDTGHLIYASGGSLRAVRFDVAKREVLSDPVTVVDGVMKLTGLKNSGVGYHGQKFPPIKTGWKYPFTFDAISQREYDDIMQVRKWAVPFFKAEDKIHVSVDNNAYWAIQSDLYSKKVALVGKYIMGAIDYAAYTAEYTKYINEIGLPQMLADMNK